MTVAIFNCLIYLNWASTRFQPRLEAVQSLRHSDVEPPKYNLLTGTLGALGPRRVFYRKSSRDVRQTTRTNVDQCLWNLKPQDNQRCGTEF